MMKFYFVGLDLLSGEHDYDAVHEALNAMHGRKVSRRIWLCATTEDRTGALADIYRGLADGDQILVVEVPERLRSPQREMDLAA